MFWMLLVACADPVLGPDQATAACDSGALPTDTTPVDTGTTDTDGTGIDTAACEPYWGTLRSNLDELDDSGDLVLDPGVSTSLCGAVAGTGAICDANCTVGWGVVVVSDETGARVRLPVTDTMDDWTICLELQTPTEPGFHEVQCTVTASTFATTLIVESHW